MAYRVEWSPRALDDVDSIAAYIARDSPAYASAVVAKIIKSTRTLRIFPLGGRIVPELDREDTREIFAYSYRIIYTVDRTNVTIAAVIHARRLLENAFHE